MPQLIELHGINVMYNDKNVLDNICLTLNKGEITTILGPNGAGKSTLVKVILDLVKPNSGHIQHYHDLRIGYVPQTLVLNETLPLTVERFLKFAEPKNAQARLEALSVAGATHLLKNNMHKLSGGEKQRVLLARAILQKPNLLVLDEPAQGVDVQGQIELYKLIQQIKTEFNCAVLMVSHDLHLVMAQTDKVICLQHHICCSGEPDAISQHPSYLEMFGQNASDILTVYQHKSSATSQSSTSSHCCPSHSSVDKEN